MQNSMSVRPPRPSLRWKSRSSPGRIRSFSTRTFTRRRASRSSSATGRSHTHGPSTSSTSAAPSAGVAGDGTRLHPRESLPRLGPPAHVGRPRLDAADERTVAALGAQIRIDVVEPRRAPAEEPQQPDDGALRLGEVVAVAAGDEHEVEVRRVRQLAAAESTEGDDGEVDLAGDGVDGPPQRGRCEVGQGGADVAWRRSRRGRRRRRCAAPRGR